MLRSTASDVGGRKAAATKLVGRDVVAKTKWKAERSMSVSCAIPPMADGQAYVILYATQASNPGLASRANSVSVCHSHVWQGAPRTSRPHSVCLLLTRPGLALHRPCTFEPGSVA